MHRRQLDIDLVRGAIRKVNFSTGKSSYPFISGDTYAGMCDYGFSEKSSLANLRKKHESIKIFLPASLKDRFLSELTYFESDFSQDILIIHNNDEIPSNSEMTILSKRFKRVYSVNWLGEKKIATPIPIGLENWSLLRNGVPKDYLKLINRGLTPASDRPIRILSSFSVHTNPKERSRALKFSESSKDVFRMPSFTSPKKYREILTNSAFVLSPPGNGADCHRTWEAIYLGAIPIVLKKYWPFTHLKLPVLIVEDWAEIPNLIATPSNWKTLSIEQLKSNFLTFP
jgi:hypothetical protein